MKFTKLLALLLVVSMLAMAFAACEPTDTTSNTSNTGSNDTSSASDTSDEESKEPWAPLGKDATDEELYNAVLGEFNEIYAAAANATSLSEKFALQAIAEAKLLESGVFLPTTSQGGRYAISRVVPNSISSVLWGNDNYRLYTILVAEEMIKAADRTAIKAIWKDAKDATEYVTKAKEYLASHGYHLKDTYTMAYSSDPQTWDCQLTYQAADSEPLVNLYDGLLEYDQKNNLVPALATALPTVSEDGLTYTFTIRQGIKWVDNQGREVGEVTADDWVASMQHLLDAEAGLEYLVTDVIAGAADYVDGTITDFSQVGVKAVDKYTLQYTLIEKASYFTTMFGYCVYAPMNRAYYQSQGGVFGKEAYAAADEAGTIKYGTSPSTIAYCGPYLVTNHTEENSLTFKANESYWNKDKVAVKEIKWLYNDGKQETKAYEDMKAGTIAGCSLNASTVKIAKETDKIFDEYAYVSATDATTFSAFFNVNRRAFANATDATAGVSAQTEEQKELTRVAMQNVHFRRALTHSVDRAAVNAINVGDDIKTLSLVNSYVPGTFVTLEEDVTVKINGEDTTFKAGTRYGEVLQAQLTADGSKIKAWDPTADDGVGSSSGFDGWYNVEAAKAELALAIEELRAAGVEVTKENPVHLDYAVGAFYNVYKGQAEAYKQCIEAMADGLVVVDLVEFEKKPFYYATYYINGGAEANYNINTFTGWGPDYGDPKTYLDTMIPGTGGMCKSIGLF